MNFNEELKKGQLVKRYKRFFADIQIENELITAHLPNTGSMKTIPLTETECYYSTSNDPKRKLKYTLEMVQTPSGLAGVNTRTPNTIVHEALADGLKKNFEHIQAELKISDKSRIDFVLWNWKGDPNLCPKKLKYPDYLSESQLELHFIEVKNVSMAHDTVASFPDGVTARGTKHLRELMELKQKGFTAEILFVVQRENIKTFEPAYDIDPLYSETLKEALNCGVKISAFSADLSQKKIRLNWTDPIQTKI